MLSNFICLCITSLLDKYSIALNICLIIYWTTSSGSPFLFSAWYFSTNLSSPPPLQYSSTIYNFSSDSLTSIKFTILGWLIFFKIDNSLSKIANEYGMHNINAETEKIILKEIKNYILSKIKNYISSV